jgi:hypothetical protein
MKKILVILIFIALGGVAWGQIPLGSNFGLTSGIPLDNRTVKADLTERDAIPAVSRYEGLTVYVESEEAMYTLVGGITNSDWVEGSAGSGGGQYPIVGTPDSTYNIFIDKAGDDITGDGTRGNPVATFQRASELAPDYLFNGWAYWVGAYSYTVQFNFGPGTWNWSEIEPYAPDYYCYFLGDTLDVIASFDITRKSDTSFYFNITDPLIADDLYKGYRMFGGIIISHHSDTLITTKLSPATGSIDIYDEYSTVINFDTEVIGLKNKQFYQLGFTADAGNNLSFWDAENLKFLDCNFYDIDGSIWFNNADKLNLNSCRFDLNETTYASGQDELIINRCYFRNVDGTRNLDGLRLYGDFTEVNTVGGVFENFDDAIMLNEHGLVHGDAHILIIDSNTGIEVTAATPGYSHRVFSRQIVMDDVNLGFDLNGSEYPYYYDFRDFREVGSGVGTIANAAINVFDEDAQQALFINKDTAKILPVLAEQFKTTYTDTIDFSDYYDANLNRQAYRYNHGATVLDLNNDKFSYYNHTQDTFYITSTNKQFSHRRHSTLFETVEDINNVTFNKNDEVWIRNFENDRTFSNSGDYLLLFPENGDTIRGSQFSGGTTQIHTSPSGTGIFDATEAKVYILYSYWGNNASADSVYALYINSRDAGAGDSIHNYYAIYHDNENPMTPRDNAYFLYSEYGDNYLNGDLTVDGRILENYPTTLDFTDYPADGIWRPYKHRKGTTTIDMVDGSGNTLNLEEDTFNIVSGDAYFFRDHNKTYLSFEEPMTSGINMVRNDVDQINYSKLNNAGSTRGREFIHNIFAGEDDTVKTAVMRDFSIFGGAGGSGTLSPNSRVDIGEHNILMLYGRYEDNFAVDSAIALHIELDTDGIDPDSIGSMYSIYNEDRGMRGSDKTYFAYSEYGDLFLGGGGELDQVGQNIIVGADIVTYNARTDDYWKDGGLVVPHYDNDEENIFTIRANTSPTANVVKIGGGSTDLNTATSVSIWAAADNTTTTGTKVGQFDIEGFHADTISELSTGEGVSVKHDLKLFDGAGLDQYGKEIIVGSNLSSGYTLRNDGTGKKGSLVVPHYTNTEENLYLIGGVSQNSLSFVDVGGGNSDYNAATAVRLFAADNTTTTTGTQVANFNTSGLQLDTISELTGSAGVNVKNDLRLVDGAELDQYGEKITLGGDDADWTARTDNTTKTGRIVSPSYDTDEETFQVIGFNSNPAVNTIFVGGGNTNHNATEQIRLYAAADQSTTTGTEIARITTDGVDIRSGALIQNQLTGSLTDGAPSDAEIDTVTGTTPAAVGAGWQVTIKDNDGTGLLYRIESDGTNWFYMVMTQAS